MQHFGNCGLDAFMGIRDDQFDTAQAAARELAQERGPESLRLGRADIEAQHLTAAIMIDADRDNDRHRDDPAVLANLQIGGVDPEIRPVAFKRPIEEGLHLAVDFLAEPADLALGDPGHPHGLDELVH